MSTLFICTSPKSIGNQTSFPVPCIPQHFCIPPTMTREERCPHRHQRWGRQALIAFEQVFIPSKLKRSKNSAATDGSASLLTVTDNANSLLRDRRQFQQINYSPQQILFTRQPTSLATNATMMNPWRPHHRPLCMMYKFHLIWTTPW